MNTNFNSNLCILIALFITIVPVVVKSENVIDSIFNENLQSDTTTVQELLKKASSFYYKDNSKVYQNAQEAFEISREIKYGKGEANSLRLIGAFHYLTGNYDSSFVKYEESRNLCEHIEYYEGLANVYNNIGVIYFRKGNYQSAIEEYYKALKINEKLNRQIEVAKLYNNLGLIYRNQEDFDLAISNYIKALRIFQSQNDILFISKVYNNIGVSYKNLEQYDEALGYYEHALELYQILDLKSDIGKSYVNIGNVYNYSDNLHKAEESYQKAFKYINENNNQINKSSLLIGYGMLYLKQGKLTEAYKVSKEAYTIAKHLNSSNLMKLSTQNLSEICYELGLYKEAYDSHVKFKNINDSLKSEKNYRKLIQKDYAHKKEKDKENNKFEQTIKELQIKKQRMFVYLLLGIIIFILVVTLMLYRNYGIKTNANKILKAKNNEIKDVNAKLKDINKTKDKLFSIIAHDLLGQFNPIIGYSDLMKTDFDTFNEDKKKDIISKFNESAETAHSMLLKLLNWSKSQKGQIRITKEALNINELVTLAIKENNAKAELKGIKLNSIVPDKLILRLDKNTISICINNLISNALKYTSKGGCVCVSTYQNSSITSIIIQDNGIGMTEGRIEKLFKLDASYTTTGTDNEKGSGLGLILCKEFVEKNGGTINIESKVNHGTKVILSFKHD